VSAWTSFPALQQGHVIVFLQKLYTRVIAEKLCPQGSVSFEWRGRSGRNDMLGRQVSLDSAMDSRVSGHSSSSEGMDRIISVVCLLAFAPL
jgi:hypothetical protein